MSALDALLTAAEAGELVGLTERRIRQLAAEGRIARAARGRFTVRAVVAGVMAAQAAERERHAGGEAESAFRQMRTAELASRLDERTGRMEAEARAAALEVVDEAGGALRAALAAVPARVTRDLAVRRKIEQELDNALDAVADRLDREAGRAPAPFGAAPPASGAGARRVGRREPHVPAQRRQAGAA